MDYGVAGAAAVPNQTALKPSPELGRLKAAAERVARATENVAYFLNRFHGPSPEGANGPTGDVPDCYRNDLDSLFAAIDRLEGAVAALEHIG